MEHSQPALKLNRTEGLQAQLMSPADRLLQGYSRPVHDADRIPPDVQEALFHQKCVRFGVVSGFQKGEHIRAHCPCCNMSERVPYHTSTPVNSLTSVGPVIPHFFGLARSLAWFCLFAAALNIPFWIKEGIQNGLLDWTQNNLDYTGRWFVFLYCVMFYILGLGWFYFYHSTSRLLAEQVNSNIQSRKGQRSVMVCDLGEGIQQTREYLEGLILERSQDPSKSPKIVQISIGKFMARIMKINQNLQQLEASLYRICQSKYATLDKEVQAFIDKRVKLINEEKKHLNAERSRFTEILADRKSAVHHHSIALITLESKEQAANILKSNKLEFLKFYVSTLCNKKRPRYHQVLEAPEPNDVIWENVGVSSVGRFSRILITNLIFFGLYVASITTQISGIVIENRWFKKLNDETSDDSFLGYILSLKLVSALITQGTNLFFSAATQWIIKSQSCLSHTETNLRYTNKLIFVQFFNTITTIVGLSFINSDHESFEALSQKFIGQLLVNLIFSTLFNIFPPWIILREAKIYYRIRRKLQEKKPILMTQSKLNSLMELPEFDLPNRYTAIVRTFLLSCFCVSIAPISFWLCAVFLAVQFWVDKYLLIRGRSLSKRMHEAYSNGIAETAELGGYCALWGNLIFSIRANIEYRKNWADHPSFWLQVAVLVVAGLVSLTSVRKAEIICSKRSGKPAPENQTPESPARSKESGEQPSSSFSIVGDATANATGANIQQSEWIGQQSKDAKDDSAVAEEEEADEVTRSLFESDYHRLNPITRQKSTTEYLQRLRSPTGAGFAPPTG